MQAFVADGKDIKFYPRVCIQSESKIEKQDLQAVDIWSQNSSSTTNKKKSKYESRKMVVNQDQTVK